MHLILRRSAAMSLVLAAACADGGGGTGPDGGRVSVTVRMDGRVPDRDGFEVLIGGLLAGTVSQGQTTFSGIPAGTHAVVLRGVSRNCQVAGGTSRTLTVENGAPAALTLDVSCPGTGMALLDDTRDWRKLRVRYPWSTTDEVLADGVDPSVPAWSPDGYTIAFVRAGSDGPRIWTVDVETGVVTRVGGGGSEASYHPAWSPDAGRMVYVAAGYPAGYELRIMNADGTGDARLLYEANFVPLNPAWSPDGTRIAFLAYRDGRRDVYVMNADGTGTPVALNATPADAYNPLSWSPDGQWLAYTGRVADAFEAFAVRADGSENRNVTQTPEIHEQLSLFRPDGTITFIPWDPAAPSPYADVWAIGVDGTGRVNVSSTPEISERIVAWQ